MLPFLPPAEGRRSVLGNMRAVDLSWHHTNCNTWESGSCTLPQQKSRAIPGGMSAGEPALRTRKQNGPFSLLPVAVGELLRIVMEN